MRILHCCLAAFYIDDVGYQENILPRIHKKQGHQVDIVASTETYVEKTKLGYTQASTYLSKDGIEVTRIPYWSWIPHIVARKLRIYTGLRTILYEKKPEILFLHDCQFLSILTITSYAKRNRVKIFVDCHTDFVNSARNWVSRRVLHQIVYRYCAKKIEPYTTKFFGTLPIRSVFLNEVYGINQEKIALLPFGVDDTNFKKSQLPEIRTKIRNKLGFETSDIVLITGGKLDRRKNIHILVDTFTRLRSSHSNIKLIVFGKPSEELEEELIPKLQNEGIAYIEWIDSKEIFKYFCSSDLAVFPGTHSVLWEEAVGIGLPAIFKRWNGIEHVDLGGNCIFLDQTTKEVLYSTLFDLIDQPDQLSKMREIAAEKGPNVFTYSEIARKAINSF